MKKLKKAQKLFGNYIFKEVIAELVKQEGEDGVKRDLGISLRILSHHKTYLFPSSVIYIDQTIKGELYWDDIISIARGKFERGC